jgi:hypothetical protein
MTSAIDANMPTAIELLTERKPPSAMKHLEAAALLVTVVILGCTFYPRNASLHEQVRLVPKQNDDIREPRQINILHQKDCAEQASQQFHRDNLDNRPYIYFFVAHYNERLKKCFVEIESISIDGLGHSLVTRSLSDLRGRDYADYALVKQVGGEPHRTSRVFCSIILSSGEEMDCSSSDEFNAVVDNYMTR